MIQSNTVSTPSNTSGSVPNSGSGPQQGRDDVVRIKCPKLDCQRILAVPINARGKLVRCRNCGTNIKIPAAAKPSPPPAKSDKRDRDAA